MSCVSLEGVFVAVRAASVVVLLVVLHTFQEILCQVGPWVVLRHSRLCAAFAHMAACQVAPAACYCTLLAAVQGHCGSRR